MAWSTIKPGPRQGVRFVGMRTSVLLIERGRVRRTAPCTTNSLETMGKRKWDAVAQEEALDWYARTQGMMLFPDVPVTGPKWRSWGPGCNVRPPEIVAVPSSDGSGIQPFEEDSFEDAIRGAPSLHLILAWGYADRSGFGHLATRKAFLERSWEPVAPVQPLALVASDRGAPNVAHAYEAAGLEILVVPDEKLPKQPGSGPRAGARDPWGHPTEFEDRLLHALWNERQRGGWWLAEVPIGGGSPRRIDAVVVPGSEDRSSREGVDLDDFRAAVAAGADVELIEAKERLNVEVVAQLLCGARMFSDQYPAHGQLSLTACVAKDRQDEAFHWFCNREQIRVVLVD